MIELPDDNELDRLKADQDDAFQRKQAAWEVQNQAWQVRLSAKEALDGAYARKQAAYEIQQAAWTDLQHLRDSNGPRIASLNDQQNQAFANMSQAFERASAAYEARDGAAAKAYSNDGHQYKAASKAAVAERRALVAEIKEAEARHASAAERFQTAKAEFQTAKATFDRAKAEHERLSGEFRAAKTVFDQARQAFQDCLERLKAEQQKRKAKRRELAVQAGVPAEYLDEVWVTIKPDGTTHFYFGGVGEPGGEGHAHYVMNAAGKLTYRREPHEERGPHNYLTIQPDYFDIIVREAPRDGDFGFTCVFRGYEAHVESNVNQQGRAKIDIYYGPNGPFGPGHHHAVAYRDDPLVFIADEIRS